MERGERMNTSVFNGRRDESRPSATKQRHCRVGKGRLVTAPVGSRLAILALFGSVAIIFELFALACFAPVALAAPATNTPAAAPPAKPGDQTPTPVLPTSTPLASPSPKPINTPTPTVTPTPTITKTPSPSPTATQIPPSPTVAHPTPEATGFFNSVFQSQQAAPGLESGLIRGRVLDFQGSGIAQVPIVCRTGTQVFTTATTIDGGYAIGGLKPGVYSVALSGFPNTPAEGIYLATSSILNVDFIESARPGTPGPGAGATPIDSASVRGQAAVVVVVLTPEGAVVGVLDRPAATPRATSEADSGRLPWQNWSLSFAGGAGVVLSVCVLAVLIALVRH